MPTRRLKKVHWLLSEQLGINLKKLLLAILALPRYVSDLITLRADYKGRIGIMPCLADWHAQAGAHATEYFTQDLLVAQLIHKSGVREHLDVGSRVDGFVAHVASFMKITVVDIRPLARSLPNISFAQMDISSNSVDKSLLGRWQSISCLHALEHIGLGRYGDPISHTLYMQALQNMSKMLKPNGILYISVPIGIKRIEFNAHQIFDPSEILGHCESQGLDCEYAYIINAQGELIHSTSDPNGIQDLCGHLDYNLAVFVLAKTGLTSDL